MTFKPSLPAYAKILNKRSLVYLFVRQILHIIALSVVVVSMLLPIETVDTYWFYILATIAMSIEFLAWWFRYLGERNHRRSSKLMRLGLLFDAFGKLSDNSIEIMNSFDVSGRIRKRAEKLDKEWEKSNPNFFASEAPVGVVRLLENLQESAFFSNRLCDKASQYIFWILGYIFINIIIAFFVFFDGNVWFPMVIVLLFVFVIADELSFAFAWREAAVHFDDIFNHLNVILKSEPDCLEIILSILCDYQIATVIAPPVPRYVYFLHRDKLNKEWDKIKQARK